MKLSMPKLTRTYMRKKVPNSCPDPREQVKAALAVGKAPDQCTHPGVMHDPRIVRWYAAPKGRHTRVTPRWGGMNLTENGKVTSHITDEEEYEALDSDDTIHEMDYADKPITWEGR